MAENSTIFISADVINYNDENKCITLHASANFGWFGSWVMYDQDRSAHISFNYNDIGTNNRHEAIITGNLYAIIDISERAVADINNPWQVEWTHFMNFLKELKMIEEKRIFNLKVETKINTMRNLLNYLKETKYSFTCTYNHKNGLFIVTILGGEADDFTCLTRDISEKALECEDLKELFDNLIKQAKE